MRPLSVSRILMSVCAPLALFPITFMLQLKLGYEVSLFPLYLIPIAAMSWEFGALGGGTSVVLATGLWVWENFLTETNYIYPWSIYYNAGARFSVFLMMGFLIVMFRRVIEQHRRRMEAMRAMLNVCHGCGALQGSNGQWVPFSEITVASNRLTCECPSCVKIAAATVVTTK